MQAEHPPGNRAPPHASPFAGLDYPSERKPSTGEIGTLAQALREIHAIDGLTATIAAILIDQGHAGRAIEAIDQAIAQRELQRLTDAERKKAMRGLS